MKKLSWVLVFLVSLAATTSTQNEGLSLNIKIKETHYLPGEPIIVTVTLRNGTKQRQFIPDGFSHNLFFDITLPNGEKSDCNGWTVCGRRPVMVTLEPGDVLQTEVNLLVNHNRLDRLGEYTVTARLKTTWYKLTTPRGVFSGEIQSNSVSFWIIQPKSIDLEVFKLIRAKAEEWVRPNLFGIEREAMASFFYYTAFGDPTFCERILQDFPTSTYAKYAAFYLAEYYRTWYGERLKRQDYIDKAMELYRKVLVDYPKFAFSGRAQWGIARCYFLKGDLKAARQEAEKTLQQYPDSFAAQEARKLLQEIEKR